MGICKYKANDEECLHERKFPYKQYCIDGPCVNYEAMTNLDYVHSMSTIRLIRWYCLGRFCFNCPFNKNNECGMEEWLNQKL